MSNLPAEISELLHPRVVEECLPLLEASFYPSAAHQAMVEVELALKEKGGGGKYGRGLVQALLGTARSAVKLRLPFGDDMQKAASAYFDGVFAYYRNYVAHDGRQIDAQACVRIMIAASELLDLVGASSRRLDVAGGLDGLVRTGDFRDHDDVIRLLRILDGEVTPDDAFDGLWEQIYEAGYSDEQARALFDLGLVEMERQILDEADEGGAQHVDVIGLTHLGRQIAGSPGDP